MTPRAPFEVPPAEAIPMPLALIAPAACVAVAAALANCALLAALLKLSKTGLYCIITQLAIVDFILLVTTIAPEIWTYYTGSWSFGHESCAAYRGLSILASTASIYLSIAITLHSLATVNLEEKSLARKIKRMNPEEDDEIRSSRHSLVACSDTSTPPRTMNVDYRLSGVRVPVAPPIVFVWVLSASLSIPQFMLSTVVYEDQNTMQCTIVESSHRLNMHTLLVIFTLILPIAILLITGGMIVRKLIILKTKVIDSEAVSALKFSILIIIVYCTMCTPRSIMDVYSFHKPKIHQDSLRLAFTSIYLVSILVRPILCAFMFKSLRQTLLFINLNVNAEDV